ncbi:sigma 54-interacting transcriptional regulator [Mucilaginibacter celer]|nr:sigma 54-interacting transcriptional regulator [Mucilaginibacter celer]
MNSGFQMPPKLNMNKSVLILDDLTAEANKLQAILLRAGFHVTGTVTSAGAAQDLLEKQKPELIILPLSLYTAPGGPSLARLCREQAIAVVLILPNATRETLESAKLPHIYGIINRPVRSHDVISAVEIGLFRQQHDKNFQDKLSRWLNELLIGVLDCPGDEEQKLLWMIKAFQPFIQFDNIIINMDLMDGGKESVYAFERLGLNTYRRKDHISYIQKAELKNVDLRSYRDRMLGYKGIYVENGPEFDAGCNQFLFARRLREFYCINSSMTVPVIEEKRLYASVGFFSTQSGPFTEDQAELLKLAQPFMIRAIKWIRDRDSANGQRHRTNHPVLQIPPPEVFKNIVGKSPALLLVQDQIIRVAPFDTTVLITGETGTGKEALVEAIHSLSPRNRQPLVKINCAAIPESLIESELFGYERGAFSGAVERRIGWFEKAQGGTIFLDEIGDLPISLQSKLLRALQEKEIQHIGGRTTIKIDVRVIVATNKNLGSEVRAKRFRPDLYFRINVFPIELPTLRDRKADLPELVLHFLDQLATDHRLPRKTVSPDAIQQLAQYEWPGNIRELRSVVERTILTTPESEIRSFTLPVDNNKDEQKSTIQPLETYEEIQRNHILKVLKSCNGKINGKGGAAEILGLPPSSLSLKMKKLKIYWKHTY